MEGDGSHQAVSQPGLCFNSRPRMEGDAGHGLQHFAGSCFNSRPRMEGDGQHEGLWRTSHSFNSRPRMEGDAGEYETLQKHIVSIHALAWRATAYDPALTDNEYVSIHALAWRATFGQQFFCLAAGGFNSRPRMEGDSGRNGN